MIKLPGNSKVAECPDQFSPYELFGNKVGTRFPGTLFRLPLRTPAQAKLSRLSPNSYTEADVAALFAGFEAEATSMILFLKHVERVQLYTWEAGSAPSGTGPVTEPTPATRAPGGRRAPNRPKPSMSGSRMPAALEQRGEVVALVRPHLTPSTPIPWMSEKPELPGPRLHRPPVPSA